MNRRKLMWLMLFAALSPAALLAQDITGTWQGTLQAGTEPRIVIKISKATDGSLQAALYNIDGNARPISATAVILQGATVQLSMATIGGSYQGKLSTDGNSINGTWTQDSVPVSLNLVRATAGTAWTIPEPLPPPKMMPADASPSFEVATIKPSRPDEQPSLMMNRSGIVTTTRSSLSSLIVFAYQLHPKQIIGGPSWLESEKYDVTGKPDVEGIPRGTQLREMIQKLLADRFQLSFHREQREMPVYLLTVAKTGPRLTKDNTNPDGLAMFTPGRGQLIARNATMAGFARTLQANILELPVVDRTGLGSAKYDFTLRWTPDEFQANGFGDGAPPAPPPPENGPGGPVAPDLFTAIRQQLGLKLGSGKAPLDVLVIDHVEKPSAN